MSELALLKTAVATFEAIARRNRSSPELLGAEWRRDLVADRRLVFEVIALFSAVGGRLLVARGDDALLRRLEENISRFRHAMALHQASWPVVAIEFEDPDYLRSRQAIRAAHLALTGVINEILE